MEPIVRGDGGTVKWHMRDMRLANLRESTIEARCRVLNRLKRQLDGRSLLDVEHADLAAFLTRTTVKGRPLAPETRAVETTHLRQFYRWCVEVEVLEDSPAKRLRRPRVPRRVPNPMPEDELAAAIELAPERVRPWLMLSAFAGLRAAEIGSLRADDLWWSHDPPVIHVKGKGGHEGLVPMAPALAVELATREPSPEGWLFPRRDSLAGPTPAHVVSQLSNRFLHDMGITRTLHKARHRFGTQVLRASGGNLRTAQEALRHASIRSTEIYTLVELGEVAKAVNGLPDIGERLTA